MEKFGNYEILEKLHVTKYTEIYRVFHSKEKTKRILKSLKSEFPSADLITRIKNEYNIITNIQSEFIIKTYSLEKEGNRYGIILEDIEGISLKDYRKGSLSLAEFYKIAILMVNAIGDVHKNNIIHKDINPSNFIYNSKTNSLKVIDFGISSNFPKENTHLENPNSLEGTLAYIAPEQTGRMNRVIDYRTDFYSLGVTFYELLCGKLPFDFQDPMELVHSHIAKQVIPPIELNANLPKPLSDLVMKLMNKTAETRYQTSYGISYDLKILESGVLEYNSEFPVIGSKDNSDKFQIPQKLYGREKEVQILLEAFERVISEKSEMLLISGYSGIGKSSVVAEIYKPITEKRGYFITGKFDQYNRNIPYKAFLTIFQDLVKQLLSESDSKLNIWRENLKDALGENAQVIIDVIPELELIIGKQPVVSEIGISESQNRFNILFQNFIQVFIRDDRPLVIFLDDLQWADGASLKLSQLLMSSSLPGLLLIGAYRDNEVSSLHPLSITLEEIQKEGAILNYIQLSPLSLETVTQIITDTVKSNKENILHLSELVYKKTQGNPFFMNEFLKSLYEEKLLEFDSKNQTWNWAIDKIEQRGFTDNVVELMTYKIQKLPDRTQELLRLAACIGNQFDLKTLSLVSKMSFEDTIKELFPAVSESFIFSIGILKELGTNQNSSDKEERIPEYKFAHDRIQQAAYYLIPEEERAKTHYLIGRLLERQIPVELLEEKIFTLVNHLNFGISFIENPDEKKSLAVFNLLAARRARSASAYQATIEYAKLALILLGENVWNKFYEMSLELHEIATEVAWLLGEFQLMDAWMESVILNAKTALEQVKVYFVKIQSLASQNKLSEAISTGKSILEKFGIHFPENPTPEDFIAGINGISSLLENRSVADLFDLPKMEDPEKLAVMNIAACLIPACYNAGSPLFVLIIIFQVKYSIQFGNSPLSSFSYTNYGILLNNIMLDIPLSDEYRQLAYRLGMEPESKIMRSGTLTGIGLFLLHRTTHLRETIPILQTGYQTGLDTGSFEFVGYSGYALCLNSFWCGENLNELKNKILLYRESLIKVNQLTAANYCSIFLGITLSLIGDSEEIGVKQKIIEEDFILNETNSSGDKTRLFYFYLHRMVKRFYLNETSLAIEDSFRVKEYLSAGGGTIAELEFYFYHSLLLLSKLSKIDLEQNKTTITTTPEWIQIETNQKQILTWAKHATMNHLHKWKLVEAEKFRVLGKRYEAEDLYEQSILEANQNLYIQEAGLSSELYAYFWIELGKKEFAMIYFQKAYYSYKSWGAKAKVELLENKFPSLARLEKEEENDFYFSGTILSKTTTDQTTRMEANLSLDLFSILKASQVISSEIILDKLLTSLMKILVENAGAQKGYLLLLQDKTLRIEIAWNTNSNQLNLEKLPLEEANEYLSISIVNYIYRTKQDLVIEDVSKSGKFQDKYIQVNKPKSVLGLPLLNQGKLIGIIYLENNLTPGAFTKDRIEILKILSSQAAISIENARLYSNLETVTKEKTKVTTEMEIAKEIQTSLLPQKPKLTGFDVATYMLTADLVGGDYFDIIHTEGREWFLIGDVSGHGVSAGLIMMMTQTAIHTILNSALSNDPAEYLRKVNKVITSNIHKMKLNKYMTLTLFLKEENGKIFYSGMHQDLLLYSAKNKTVEIIETKGSWLGYYDLFNEYEVNSIQMNSGDVLLLFTDGVTESTNRNNEMYEMEGLVKILNQNGDLSAEEIKNKILNSLKEFKTDDDITFMVCKRES